MKNSSKILAFILIAVFFTNCAPTNKLTIGVTEPALVHLSPDITRVGIINRSVPSKGNNTLDKIDRILSAEGLNLDKKGAEAAVSSLSTELSVLKNFEEIKILSDIEEVKKGLAVLPATLSWVLVEKICLENEVNVLFLLEFYDTDTKADYRVTTMKLPNNMGINVDIPAQEVTLATSVVSGWRVYDPHMKVVVDEQVYTKNMAFRGKGINPMKAIEAVANRNETVQEYSRNVGIAYAERLIPKNRRIAREYFVRGTDNFKIAQRRAQAGDWDGAAKLWERELTNSNEKVAGRAYYNMAISNEINCDLDKAIQLATKSYSDYRTNIALDYINVLKHRVRQNQELNSQLAR